MHIACGTKYSATDLSSWKVVPHPSSKLSYNVLERKMCQYETEEWGLHIVDGKYLPKQTDKPTRASLTDRQHIVVARKCATRGGRPTHVGNMVYIAVVCAHIMRGTRISNSELHTFLGDCMYFRAIARC